MKAIIQIESKLQHNKDLEILNKNPFNINIIGKSFLSYYLDFLGTIGVTDIYILGEFMNKYVESFYLSKVYTPKIHFEKEQSFNQYYRTYENYLKDDDLIIIKNIGFISNSFKTISLKIKKLNNNFFQKEKDFEVIYIKKYHNALQVPKNRNLLLLFPLTNIGEFIKICHSVLINISKVDYMNGYSQKNGIIMGKNISIGDGVTLVPPLIIQDDVNISDYCTVGPNTIISSNVYIHENSVVRNTFIGQSTITNIELDLKDKIVIHNRLINKNNSEIYEVDQQFISKAK